MNGHHLIPAPWWLAAALGTVAACGTRQDPACSDGELQLSGPGSMLVVPESSDLPVLAKVAVTNMGSVPAALVGFEADARAPSAVDVVDALPLVIEAGETVEINVSIDPDGTPSGGGQVVLRFADLDSAGCEGGGAQGAVSFAFGATDESGAAQASGAGSRVRFRSGQVVDVDAEGAFPVPSGADASTVLMYRQSDDAVEGLIVGGRTEAGDVLVTPAQSACMLGVLVSDLRYYVSPADGLPCATISATGCADALEAAFEASYSATGELDLDAARDEMIDAGLCLNALIEVEESAASAAAAAPPAPPSAATGGTLSRPANSSGIDFQADLTDSNLTVTLTNNYSRGVAAVAWEGSPSAATELAREYLHAARYKVSVWDGLKWLVLRDTPTPETETEVIRLPVEGGDEMFVTVIGPSFLDHGAASAYSFGGETLAWSWILTVWDLIVAPLVELILGHAAGNIGDVGTTCFATTLIVLNEEGLDAVASGDLRSDAWTSQVNDVGTALLESVPFQQDCIFAAFGAIATGVAEQALKLVFAALDVGSAVVTIGTFVAQSDDASEASTWTMAFSGDCLDSDGDGYCAGDDSASDCQDSDPDVHPGTSEDCDGKDQDCDGTIDNPASCWLAVYRYADSDGAHCWDSTAAADAESQCAGYSYETEAWFVPAYNVPGTWHAVLCSKLTDHIIVEDGGMDMGILQADGYVCGQDLGYPYDVGSGPASGATMFDATCPLYRFADTLGSGLGVHLFSPHDDGVSDYDCEWPARADVLVTGSCYSGPPGDCSG